METLREMFPMYSAPELRKMLEACGGNLEKAVDALVQGRTWVRSSGSSRKRSYRQLACDVLVIDSSSDGEGGGTTSREGGDSASGEATEEPSAQPAEISAFSRLKRFRGGDEGDRASGSSSGRLPSLRPPLTTPGKQTNSPPPRLTLPTRRLSQDPAAIARETHHLLSYHPHILPKKLALRLFLRMLEEEKTAEWQRNEWFLATRRVTSPHTTCHYRRYWNTAENDAEVTWYNGERRQSRAFPEEMEEAARLVEAHVNQVLAKRERHPLEYQGPWHVTGAASNCYRGSQEHVGYHSDALSYLGPYTTIASLSLGVSRPFRIRPTSDVTFTNTMELMLQHNSLCIMHAGCQETFKHTVPPVRSIDLFSVRRASILREYGRSTDRFTERINITFRFYRPDFAGGPLPAPENSHYLSPLPVCACGVPCVLRPDLKGKVQSRAQEEATAGKPSSEACGRRHTHSPPRAPALTGALSSDPTPLPRGIPAGPLIPRPRDILFFWSCTAGQQNDGKTCRYFKLLDYESEKRGLRQPGPAK